MMLTELLATLRDLKVHLYVEGDTLKCRAPRDVLTDELKNQLKTRKKELIKSLIQIGKHHHAPITKVLRTKSIPLSFAQQRLWFLDQLEPGSSFYNIPVALQLKGKLNEAALEQSLNEIVRRHESLRTTFITVKGQAEQAIATRLIVPVVRVDLTGLPEQIRQTLTLNVCHQEATNSFNLSSGPLVRVTLISLCDALDSQEYVLLVTLHHIISDGWSSGLLTNEFIRLYKAYSEGKTSPLEELPIQYADFACWQRQWLDGEVLQQQIDYWHKQLSGVSAILELPTDYPRPPVISYCGANHHFTVPLELSKQIYSLSRSHDVTLFVTLLAVFKVLLFRYSHQQDVCVGTPIANRNRLEIESLIGFFVNTLVLRSKLSGDQQFDTLLNEIRNTVLDAQNHQDLPFEQLVEILRPERNMSYSPLFQVMFTLQNTTRQSSSILDLEISSLDSEGTTAKFDLTLHISEDETGLLTGVIEYNTDLFDQSTIARLAEHYLILLQGIVIQPHALISELPLLSATERRQLLIGFNDTAEDYPHDRLIHQLFEAQVQQAPDATAIVYEAHSLSYRELNQQANRLAHYLLELGIRPDDRVAICVERSLDLVVGLLGILKAGGAYVPLDPGYPGERLATMLSDSAPMALLTQAALQGNLAGLETTIPVVLLDAETASGFSHYPEHNPDPEALGLTSRHLAYVIYTSGSTGQPKGVMVEHGHVARLFAATQEKFNFGTTDVWTLFHSFAFDFSVWELWGALLYGGRLVIVSYNTSRSPQAFYQLLCQQQVTVLNQTPSAFRQLISAQMHSTEQHALRCVVFGGEALEFHSLKPWIEHNSLAHTQLINMYGITEITVHATYRAISQTDIDTQPGSVIGKPLPDLRFYLLDTHLQPVPLGVTGEIYIGGAGVARGYLNRPELTAERFLVNPFSQTEDNPDTGSYQGHHPGGKDISGRLYKTGDLGRWLPDGSIEYLGRNDFQVKIRGFRIELGEIEAQLAKCPGVREAVVIAREDSPGDKRLVAYLLAQDHAELSAATLRSQLATVLADYQLPSAYVTLDAFPLTPNGKLDRKALPAPDGSAVVSRPYAAPQGPIETALARIWQELLGLEQVGRYDHFFELGGHSLMVVTLIERLRQQGLSANVRTVFTTPILTEMAAVLDASDSHSPAFVVPANLIPADCAAITPDLLPLVSLTQHEIDHIVDSVPQGAANIQDIYPLAPLQEGILFHHLLETQGDAYLLRSVISFDSRSRLDSFLEAMQRVINRHDILRTAICWEGLPQPVQVVYRQAPLPVEELALSNDSDALAQLLNQTNPRHLRLDLQRAPLLTAFIANVAQTDTWHLALIYHHLVDDNYTLQLILSEIELLLQGQGENLPVPLPYRNFIAYTLSVPPQVHEAYFRAQLGDINEPTAPFGLLNVQGDGEQVSEATLSLNADLAQRIRASAKHQGINAAVLFYVAWAQVLSKCTGRDDVVFGTVLSGRLQGTEGADRVLGMFINTLPIRLSLAGHSVQQIVADAYQRLSNLLDHEQASLALAQRCSIIPATLPLFTTLFNYRNIVSTGNLISAQDRSFAWDGVKVHLSEERTNYPITLAVNNEGQGFSITAQCVQGIDPERIAAYLNTAIEGLVDALAENPQRLINTLNILPASERRQLLIGFNDTAEDYPHDRLIHQLFEAQAQQAPDATAIVYEAHSLSYRELNQQANRLAHYLLELGIRPDDRVAICVERSLDMVVGLLGILKAGGAYVPLDPGYPGERLATMLSDSAPMALLTQAALQGNLAGLETTIPVVLLDAETASGFSHYPAHNPDPKALGLTSRHLAYVIYTSGSTGQPKGVMVEHGHVARLFAATQEKFNFGTTDVWTLFHSFAFDFSVWELWGALLYGGRLVIVSYNTSRSPQAFYQLLCQQQVTVLNQTPSAFRQLISAQMHSTEQHALRCVVFGGEALEFHSLKPWIEHNSLAHTQLINMYGITEITVHATYRAISQTDIDTQPGSVIGKPLPDLRFYLLDTHLQPVPLGVTGEIYIGGAGVARGYLNRPELTAERFLVNPFSQTEDNPDTGSYQGHHPGGKDISGRLYKTGDLGRWLPDGSIEYLGRNDFQVKIRGFRIELGEIEAQLAKCPGVREAVVIAREDSPGDKRLVAYLLAQDHAELSAATLRSQLATVLADYQLPSAYVTLDAFPLTPNGKLDRKALPAPDGSAVVSRPYAAPQGPIETALARIWQELLGLEQVGRYDHFFELGGHSLMVVTLIERLRQQGLSASVRTVFTTPILTEMAAVLDASDSHSPAFVVPANLIPADCAAITPDLLPLVSLTQHEIDHIVDSVPQGAANIQDIYPLAPLQEGILFHHLLETQGDAYLLRSVISFDSRSRLDSFLEAMQRVINRHDILRTAICWEGLPQPVQVVYRQAPLPVEELLLETGEGGQAADTIAGIASTNDTALQQLLARTDPRHLRLDLQSAPLFKAIIAADLSGSDGPQGHGQWLLALLNHHLVCDHLTLELIIAEIQQILQGQAEQLPASLPYRNFIAQALAASPAEHEAYFRTQLGDIDEPTAPFGLLNVQGDGGQVTEARLPLSTDLAQRIRRAARQQGVSAAVLFHVAWAQVLGQCTGRDDVVFGTVLLGRLHGSAGADRVLGMFINTLPVRISLAGLSASEVVSATYQRLSDLLDHEQASLALAQRCSGVDASLPLFTTLFNYRHSPGDTTEHDLTTASTAGEENTHFQSPWEGIRQISGEERTNYPIDISVDDLGQGFSINAQSVPGVDPERIAAYLNTAIEGLVDALAENPQRLINTLTILPASERRQLLIGFNDTAEDYPHDRLIHQLFEAQAQQAPDATAIVYEAHSLSYRELNQQANRLAHYLLELGIRPDDRVAICVERSLDMVVGLLGILKAGGAYVPLDPGYPGERLATMLSDSAPIALLTQAALQGNLAGLETTIPVVLLDAETASGFSHYPAHNPDPKALGLTARHLAYVIYTSGSTGQPKGVMVEHGNVARLFAATQEKFNFGTTDVWTLFHSFAFDFSVWELWGALLYGGRLVIVSYNTSRSPQAFYQLLCQQQVTVLNQTPSAFRQLISAQMHSTEQHALRCVVFGGEALEFHSLKPWIEHNSLAHTQLINMYGITEITVHATYRAISQTDIDTQPASVIGKPLPDLRFYLLDTHLQPVPLGVTGEIYIGGAGVARGYLNRPELTAERFLVNPFSPAEGNLDIGTHQAAHPGGLDTNARLYKTGDLGRWLPDDSIEFLGRNDFQVKIRGFRIELGEIEAQLAKCLGVREAVVIAREDSPGDKRLVAYLLAQDHAELSAATLRSQLATVLADYQLPSAYVTLDAFPLTPNGKLDRKALPAPDGSAVVSRPYAAPQGPIETALARIWQELLGLEQVGRYDHFFELGGHSLMAVQLVSRLRQELGEISLNTVFAQPTLRGFAFAITTQSTADKHTNLVFIRSTGSLRPLFLVPPRGGHANYARLMLPWLDADLPIYGISVTGFMKEETPLLTIEEMAAFYIQAIRRVQPKGPYRIAGYSSGGTIAYEIAYQLMGIDENVEFLGLIDSGIQLTNKVTEHSDDFDECKFFLQELQYGETPVSLPILEELKLLAALGDFNAMLERCHSANLIPQEIDSATLRRYLAVYHANDLALAAYFPAPMSIPLYLFAATDNNSLDDNSYGWESLVGNLLQIIPIGGDHNSIIDPPHIETLGKAISEVLRHVSDKSPRHLEQHYSPMVLIQNGRAGILPLFCVPGAGAGVTTFFDLSQALDTDLPVYGLQPRGLDGILVPHIDVPSAARAYIKAIREVSPTGPYRLLGHSFGGLVVFEMALQLMAAGEQIDTLVVLDSEAPSIPSDKMQRYSRVGMLLELVNLYELSINSSLALTAADFSSLNNEQQLTLLLSRLIEVKLMPPRTTIETLRGIVRVFAINLNTDYIPKGLYPGEIHLVGVANIESNNLDKDDNYRELITKWQQHVSKVTFWEGPGNHMTLLSPTHVLKLADWLSALLIKK